MSAATSAIANFGRRPVAKVSELKPVAKVSELKED
jgi:hypothetical protein